ncbi:porin [Azospirillum halopraeferens]|uniref:porin n=1 Tax=Azospirillum halopraeferens TaxID=34010 RepID=UPI000406CCC9|nr:porin [Azospirillum halopraeferens]
MAPTTRAGRALPSLIGAIVALHGVVAAGSAAASGLGFADRFVRLDGAWGALEVGETAGAPARLMVTGPATRFWPRQGIGSGEAAKATYLVSPFGDLQVGVSYAPTVFGASLGDARHVIEGAVRHATHLRGAALDFTVGGVRGRARNPLLAAPLRSLMAGGAVTWRHLSFGGAVREQTVPEVTRRNWSAGIAYETGSWGVRGQMAGTLEDGTPSSGGWDTGVRYRLTPGVAVTAAVTRTRSEEETTVLRLGTRIAF